jgi:hypothetical protein
LIKVDKKHLIQDHPNEIGFLVLRDENSWWLLVDLWLRNNPNSLRT